jgi:hypothetical protein
MPKYFAVAALAGLLLSACGYTLQTSQSALVDKENIHRVWVAPLINNSYKPGVENVVYNALVRTLKAHNQVVLTGGPESADAILQGTVVQAFYAGDASTQAQSLNSQFGSGPVSRYGSTVIATEYSASLNCLFTLRRPKPLPPGKREVVWTSTFTRTKPFPASNQLFSAGTTSALINESEFDRALSDIANSMMGDVDESMLAVF